MGDMFLGFDSAYPGLGVWTATETTIPDASDKATLVDDTEAQTKATTDPKAKRNILLAVALIFLLVIGGGIAKG